MAIWAPGPAVLKAIPDGAVHWDHERPLLHQVRIEEVGGLGEPNAGEFLVSTPCGYRGWVRALNKNPDALMACEACLNGMESKWWIGSPMPDTAVPACFES